MDAGHVALLSAGVFVIALLYSSVGHAGASGFIAVMSLLNMAPQEVKPIALVLNIFVASVTAWHFYRAGHFSWGLFWPFAALSVPLAMAGGYINLPTHWFKILVGAVLLFSSVRLWLQPRDEAVVHAPKRAVALGVGGFLGLLAGLTGTGGGIFLTPILLFARWARVKTAGAVSALFILVNSLAGLAGNVASTGRLPGFAWILVVVVLAGGACGSYLGSRHFRPVTVRRTLGIVLAIAGAKLVMTH